MAIKNNLGSSKNLLKIIHWDSNISHSGKIYLSACCKLLKIICLNSGRSLYLKNRWSSNSNKLKQTFINLNLTSINC